MCRKALCLASQCQRLFRKRYRSCVSAVVNPLVSHGITKVRVLLACAQWCMHPRPWMRGCVDATPQVKTVEGSVDLKVPSGTQPGTTLVMAKRGVPRLGSSNVRGDHQVCA